MTGTDERTGAARMRGDPQGAAGPAPEPGAAPLFGAAPQATERPVLAPSTWLIGHLHESALVDPPWAVEQPGAGRIPMGELAYRIAEQANGEQTVDEIATAVSAALERSVTVADVRALIDTVLIPRGVLSAPHGAADAAAGDGRWGSDPYPVEHAGHPLGLAARRAPTERVIGPARLEAAASVLMWLFWPPVMAVVLGGAVTALLWLFCLHGLAPSVIAVLTEPVRLVPALILTALIVAAQSFGPMAALYSAGARVERLRYAPSVLHPRITVDIADDYGLSRWSRLTVNLSGVYLQLALVLATCLVAIVTGAEFLYLTVALVTLNMVRLLLPFGRPDADRLLRDALLVDDPLRYAGATLARRIPGIVPAAPSLPALKRWGHLAIWLYLAVAALLVLMLGAAVLWATPTVLVTLRDALLAHLTALPEAIGERGVLGIVGGVIQSAVLVLAVFVLAVLLVVGARRLVVAVWAWSRRGPSHRRIAGVGALVLLLVVALAWIPIPAADAPDAALTASPRSLAGVPFRPLTYASRGTLFDLFRSVPDLAP